MNRYADWKAPARDGGMLLWPAPDRLSADAHTNHVALASATTQIQNADLSALRDALRESITGDADRLIVATGHQIEMYHPGVWAKNVLIETAARKIGGVAVHVAVDTDSPKHLEFRWPGTSRAITDDPALVDAAWSGLVRAPTAVHARMTAANFAKASSAWSFEPVADPLLAHLARHSAEKLPAALLDGTLAVDRAIGIGQRLTVVLSDLLLTTAYNAFAHHIAALAGRFAGDYNAALAAYRAENNVRSPQRPMPDLQTSADRVELPFWLDDLSAGTRVRAFAVRVQDVWTLDCNSPFAFDPQADAHAAAAALAAHLTAAGLRLSPRALTLTMFMRLLIADQFVHGIGGGRYDQVCDGVIERFFQMPAPAFSVTTATLYFPTAGQRADVCVPCLKSEGHALKHAALGDTKQAYLQSIAAAPRKSPQRRASFVQMHRDLAEAYDHNARVPAWQQRLTDAIGREKADDQIFDREFFYGIQPRDRLTAMIEQYRIAFG